jgi:ABC-2 type transport system ATP-binding protein
MSAIIIRNLTRTFGKTIAVDDLSLKIPAGSLFGLIGPNGAGKTTTLRMLAGLLEPTSGEIRVNELSIRQYWQELQWQIGYMPDFFGTYEDLLVWEYLDFFARCYRLAPPRRRQVVDELLELVDLAGKRDAYVSTLSRGMTQRLCLAHALVHDPQILLLDEPASGLDPRARVEMRELLRELSAMGKTIVLSSHILTELAELCDTVAIMETGRLVASGPLDDIRRHASDRRILRIQVLAGLQRAEAVLSTFPAITQVAQHSIRDGSGINSEGVIELEFSGSDTTAADLLDALISHEVRIASYGEVMTNLEEAFLRLTKGDVA